MAAQNLLNMVGVGVVTGSGRADDREGWIALSSLAAAGIPIDAELRRIDGWPRNPIISAEDMMVRRHLQAAVKELHERLESLALSSLNLRQPA